mgnify:CR=1 FL=1
MGELNGRGGMEVRHAHLGGGKGRYQVKTRGGSATALVRSIYSHALLSAPSPARRCAAWAAGRYSGLRAERLESNVTRSRSDLLLWGEDDVALAEARAALLEQQGGGKGAAGNGDGNGKAGKAEEGASGSRL